MNRRNFMKSVGVAVVGLGLIGAGESNIAYPAPLSETRTFFAYRGQRRKECVSVCIPEANVSDLANNGSWRTSEPSSILEVEVKDGDIRKTIKIDAEKEYFCFIFPNGTSYDREDYLRDSKIKDKSNE